MASCRHDAGIAQLVERNLAKVEVASSRLVSRSRFSAKRGSPCFPFLLRRRRSSLRPAQWQSGYAADCKSVYVGSIPACASNLKQAIMAVFAAHAKTHAGIAQLVERNLAKVEVARSRLVSRSRILTWPLAWGHAKKKGASAPFLLLALRRHARAFFGRIPLCYFLAAFASHGHPDHIARVRLSECTKPWRPCPALMRKRRPAAAGAPP